MLKQEPKKVNKRLDQCIENLWFPFSPDFAFMSHASVPSLSDRNLTHTVTIVDCHADNCDCIGHVGYGHRCIHMKAVDLVLAGDPIPAAEIADHQNSGLDEAIHEYLNLQEKVASNEYDSCVVCGRMVRVGSVICGGCA